MSNKEDLHSGKVRNKLERSSKMCICWSCESPKDEEHSLLQPTESSQLEPQFAGLAQAQSPWA